MGAAPVRLHSDVEEADRELQRTMGQKLQEAREAAGMLQKDLARLLQCSQGSVSAYEAGNTAIPLRHLVVIARVLQVSLDDLFGTRRIGPKKKQKR